MDTSDPDITFDSAGVCHHCRRYENLKNHRYVYAASDFDQIIDRIKVRGKKHPYDCISALSGGTDSSYLLHKLKDRGLRVLAVHYDSGWNSSEAIHNVRTLTEKMGVDLYTYTVDWEEFKAIQLSYLRAGVVDLDVPTDHALHGSLYKAAVDKNVPFILTGHNFETECVMPDSWVTDKLDSRNLTDIHNKFGDRTPIKTFPLQTPWTKFMNYTIRKIEMIFILNYLKYHKEDASKKLQKLYGWAPVRVKHGESVWTRFYQCHILYNRFGIDKRKAHFSNLILSGVMKREDALEELKNPPYKDNLLDDKMQILDRFGISDEEFDQFMNQPIRKHSDFKTEKGLKGAYRSIRKMVPFLKVSTKH